jgi:hypothetical protein
MSNHNESENNETAEKKLLTKKAHLTDGLGLKF